MRNWDLRLPRFRMRGLLPQAVYRCEDGREMTGEALMGYGLALALKGDCASVMSVWHLKEEEYSAAARFLGRAFLPQPRSGGWVFD